MSRLNEKEIQNIAVLLLSPDSKNIELALTLLEQHSYAIPTIQKQIEVFLIFNPKQKKLKRLVRTVIPDFALRNSPIFALSFNEFSGEVLELFERHGTAYEQWIAQDIDRTKVYAKFAELVGGATRQPELVVKYFKLTLRYFPDMDFYWLRMADTLRSITKDSTAIHQYKKQIVEAYNKAFELEPSSHTLVELANFFQNDVDNFEMAKQTWEKCLELFPQHQDPLFGYAEYFVKTKNWVKAKETAEACLEILKPKPYLDFQNIYLLLATIEWKGFHHFETAEYYYQQAYEQNEDMLEPVEQLTTLYLENKDTEKALAWQKKLLRFQPSNILWLCKLAELSRQVGLEEEARIYYQKVLSIAPDYGPALDGLGYC